MSSGARWIIGALVFLVVVVPIVREGGPSGVLWLAAVGFILWRVARALPREDGVPRRDRKRTFIARDVGATAAGDTFAPPLAVTTSGSERGEDEGDVVALRRQLDALGLLRDRGLITAAEYEQRRARAIADF